MLIVGHMLPTVEEGSFGLIATCMAHALDEWRRYFCSRRPGATSQHGHAYIWVTITESIIDPNRKQ